MPRSQRVAQYIQRLAYENLLQPHERDERPPDDDEAQLREPTPTPHYSAWSATSFYTYVPFRGPTGS
jgi:hypothetical protein